MIPIELLMLYGFAAIVSGLVMWHGEQQEARFWREKAEENRRKAWAALLRDVRDCRGLVKWSGENPLDVVPERYQRTSGHNI